MDADTREQLLEVERFRGRIVDQLTGAGFVECDAGAERAGRDLLTRCRHLNAELSHRHAGGAPTAGRRPFGEHQHALADHILGATEDPFGPLVDTSAQLTQDQ